MSLGKARPQVQQSRRHDTVRQRLLTIVRGTQRPVCTLFSNHFRANNLLYLDVWSLGCVFLEIWTVLKGESVSNFLTHLQNAGSMSTCYYLNPSSISSWLAILTEKSGIPSDNAPRSWISNMMKKDQNVRWSARMILDDIQEVNSDTNTAFTFSGLCCIEDLASAESVYSATDDSELLQSTDPSNAQSQPCKSEIDIPRSLESGFCLPENLLCAESTLKLENKRQIMVGLDDNKHGQRISKEFDKKSNDVANASNNQGDPSSVEEMRPGPKPLPFIEASNASLQSKLPSSPALQSFEPMKSTEDKKGLFFEIPKPISKSQPGEVQTLGPGTVPQSTIELSGDQLSQLDDIKYLPRNTHDHSHITAGSREAPPSNANEMTDQFPVPYICQPPMNERVGESDNARQDTFVDPIEPPEFSSNLAAIAPPLTRTASARPSVSAGLPIAAPERKDSPTISHSDEKVRNRRLHLNLSSTPFFEHLQLATSSSVNGDATTQPFEISGDTSEPLQLLVAEPNEALSTMVTPPLPSLGDNEQNEKLKNEAQPGLAFPHDNRLVRSSASMVGVLGTKAGASSNATPLKNGFLKRQFSFEGNPGEMELTKTISRNIEQPPTIPASNCNPRVLRYCGKCGRALSGQYVRALGKTFHLECFSCEVRIT